MRQSIRGYADGLVDRTGVPERRDLASEISAVAGIVAGSDELRRALNDPGVPAPARRAILADLFAGRVGGPAMALFNFVVDADRAPETVANLEWLAVRFDANANNMEPMGEAVLGRKGAEERIDGYATATLEAVQGERALGNLEDELFRFTRVISGADDLRAALTSRDLPVAARRRLVEDLLVGKASPEAAALAGYATRVGRPRDYVELLEAIVVRVAAESNRRVADVRAAVELDEQQQARLADALARALGYPVEVRVSVDTSLLAGFVATIGDTVVDGSARHRLEILRERLIMPEANITTGERH